MGSNGRSDPCLGRAMLRVPSAVGIGTFAGISARRLAADRRWSGDPWSHWFYLASEASLTKPPTGKKVDSGEKRVDRRLPRTRCFRHDFGLITWRLLSGPGPLVRLAVMLRTRPSTNVALR